MCGQALVERPALAPLTHCPQPPETPSHGQNKPAHSLLLLAAAAEQALQALAQVQPAAVVLVAHGRRRLLAGGCLTLGRRLHGLRQTN